MRCNSASERVPAAGPTALLGTAISVMRFSCPGGGDHARRNAAAAPAPVLDQPAGGGPPTVTLSHHQGGHHAVHALVGLGVADDVAVPDPRAGLVGVDEDGVALTRSHGDRVLHLGIGERIAVLGDDQLAGAV